MASPVPAALTFALLNGETVPVYLTFACGGIHLWPSRRELTSQKAVKPRAAAFNRRQVNALNAFPPCSLFMLHCRNGSGAAFL
jgi:hypothetical protein